MKEALGALLVGLVLGVSVPWLRTAFEAQPSEKDQPRKPVERRTYGQGFVKLDHPRQVSAGIVSANPQPMQLAAEVEAYGRVLDPMPLTTLCSRSTRPKRHSTHPPKSMRAPRPCSPITRTPQRALWNPLWPR